MFVVIKNGGKQYKVQTGDIIKLDYLGQDKGKTISIKEVLACNVDNKDYIGSPYLKNVEVKIEILENKKDKKVLVFKKRRRHNSRRLNGHRQSLSVVKINDILLDGNSISKDNKNKVSVAKKNTNSTKKNEATSKKVLKTKQPKPKKE
jgi:large subunit ribosomal protein L21